MREALAAAQDRGLTRVQLAVIKSNVRVQKLYRKTGFVEKGLRRNFLRIDGVYHDDALMALLFE